MAKNCQTYIARAYASMATKSPWMLFLDALKVHS